MPLTNTQALLLSNDAFLQGLTENEPRRIQMSHVLEFFEIDGDKLTIPRVTSANLGTAIFDAGGTAVSDTPAVPTSPNPTFSLKLLISMVKTNQTAQYTMSNVNNQEKVALAAAVRRMTYQFWTAFNTGNEGTNPQEFNGLRQLVVAGQTVTANGGAGGVPTLAEFDQLIGKVKASDGHPTVLYTSRKGLEALKKAHYNLNSVPSEYMDWEVPRPGGGTRTVRTLCWEGVPVIVDDSVPNDEQPGGTSTSVYALALGREGLHGIVPRGTRESMFRVSKSLVDGKAQDQQIVSWAVGLALASEQAIARLEKVASS
ncbi:MAG: hypothetical protein HUU15_16250 [Candidatus Brocadiae bacterium]|nr:hypothetical protein [Candidatus Brocadiia bacterium]